jgi:hypothetical protein
MAAKKPARRAPKTDTDGLVLVDGGGIEWTIRGTLYTLRLLRVGEWFDLREARLSNARKLLRATQVALAMPTETLDEQDAKVDALTAARKLSLDLSYDWWMAVFKTCCDSTPPAPDPADLPGWATSADEQDRVIAHLVGPFASGTTEKETAG